MFARRSERPLGRVAIGLALVWLGAFGCQSGAPTPATATFLLGGTTWRAVEIEGRATDPGVTSTLVFEGDQLVSGSAGCNRYTAPLSVVGSSIRVGAIAMTRMACPPPAMNQESRFTAVLEAARGFRQEGDVLWLVDEQGRSVLRFARA